MTTNFHNLANVLPSSMKWYLQSVLFFFFLNVTFFFLENVSENLQIQGSEMQDSHKAIVKDLADVRHQAQDIYQKIGNQNTLQSEMNHKHAVQKCFVSYICISFPYGWSDHSMLEFLHYQDQTSQYYTDLMNKLERMNSTLGLTLHYLDNMQSRIEEKLHMIQGYLGWAGETWHPECSDHSFELLVGQKTNHLRHDNWLLFHSFSKFNIQRARAQVKASQVQHCHLYIYIFNVTLSKLNNLCY